MLKKAYSKLRTAIINWLIYEPPAQNLPPYDFERLKYEIRPGDVLLIEGYSRISHAIRTITQSPWTHSALYIGRLIDYEDEASRSKLRQHTSANDNTSLIIEGLIDKGAALTPLSTYHNQHIRICRAIGITPADTQAVLNYAINLLGQPYNFRQLLDLARFVLPWSILPRRWGSSLFRTRSGKCESGLCSSLIAEAFTSVQFPILPYIKSDGEEGMELFHRNPHLFMPKDFDYSPYFAIIKHPLFNPDEPLPYYRRLPWTKKGLIHHDNGIVNVIEKQSVKNKLSDKDSKPYVAKTTKVLEEENAD